MRTPQRMIDGMVPIAPDHLAYVANRQILPGVLADVLPAGNLFEHQQAISSQASRK